MTNCVSAKFSFSHLRMLRFPRVLIKNIKIVPVARRLTTAVEQKNAESEVAEYPPIEDWTIPLNKGRKARKWSEKIAKIGTIEEKLIEINLPRYYGYKCLMLNEREYHYNTLPFFQYATNTEFVEEKSHVPTTEEEAKKTENLLAIVRSEIQDALEFELDGYK